MISVELVQVAILWCIAGVGVICAMNARGLLRQLASWLIVIAIIITAVFFSYMEVETLKQEIGLTGPPQSSSSEPVAKDDTIPIAEEVVAESDTFTASYINVEKQLLANILSIADSILAFPEWPAIQAQGIEKREVFESKARFLRNKSMDSYRQIRNLTPPPEKKLSYEALLDAADNLRLAGYEVHNQFGLEDALGESIAKARERANLVKSAISTITNKE
ncbi:MAG: hypothetical protein FWB90_01385 [Fibromonadales bacterium]|nr:hypothetical protein [Fibromonadales bacterium]